MNPRISLILLVVFLPLLNAACNGKINLEESIATGISQTLQISQLETEAAFGRVAIESFIAENELDANNTNEIATSSQQAVSQATALPTKNPREDIPTSIPPSATVTSTATPTPTVTSTSVPVPDPNNASISGIVWQDVNADGSLQPGELGIAFQKVVLTRSGCINAEPTDGNSISSQLSGGFTFKDLRAGTYCVTVKRQSECNWFSVLTTTENSHDTLIGDGLEIQLGAGETLFGASFGYSQLLC